MSTVTTLLELGFLHEHGRRFVKSWQHDHNAADCPSYDVSVEAEPFYGLLHSLENHLRSASSKQAIPKSVNICVVLGTRLGTSVAGIMCTARRFSFLVDGKSLLPIISRQLEACRKRWAAHWLAIEYILKIIDGETLALVLYQECND